MPLVDFGARLQAGEAPPRSVRAFLREADRRIEEFQARGNIHGFIPSDYPRVYTALHALAAAGLATGPRFCEWGSGFGVVTGLAAMLGFDAAGIEVEGELVDAARLLAEDFDLPVEFIRGSFIPRGAEHFTDTGETFAWLITEVGDAYEELGRDVDDFDVIFVYPWPDEEDLTAAVFERYAGDGAILITFQGGDDIRVRRKVARPAGRRGKARRQGR